MNTKKIKRASITVIGTVMGGVAGAAITTAQTLAAPIRIPVNTVKGAKIGYNTCRYRPKTETSDS